MKVLTWVWHDCDVTEHTDLLVMLALADEADDDGSSCFPSIRRIASKTRLSVGGVHKVLERIEADGRVVIERPEQTGRGRHNRYEIDVPWKRSPGEPLDGETFTERTETFTNVHPKSERTHLPDQRSNPGADQIFDNADFVEWKPTPSREADAKAKFNLTDVDMAEFVAIVSLEGLTGKQALRRWTNLIHFRVKDNKRNADREPTIQRPAAYVPDDDQPDVDLNRTSVSEIRKTLDPV